MADLKSKLKLICAIVAVVVAVAVAVVFFQFRRQRAGHLVTLPQEAANALMMLSRVHQTASQNGKIQWELKAESAQLESGSNRMLLDSPEVEFVLEDGSKAHLTADKGVLDTRTKNIQVSGHVQVRNDRYTLLSEALDYQHAKRMLESKGPVEIISATITIKAAAMIYDLETNQARFMGNVEGNLNEKTAI